MIIYHSGNAEGVGSYPEDILRRASIMMSTVYIKKVKKVGERFKRLVSTRKKRKHATALS